MIETIEGVKNAHEIAKIPGVDALFAASGDLGNFSGYAQGSPDYERLINVVHDAAIGAGKRLCGPFAWRDRPDFTCFQNASETAAIAPAWPPSWARSRTRRARSRSDPLQRPRRGRNSRCNRQGRAQMDNGRRYFLPSAICHLP